MDSSRKSNKIRDIVRLQQILKKWKKVANNNKTTTTTTNTASTTTAATTKSIKFLKKTLSFTESSTTSGFSNSNAVPKGFIAVCVGQELKRYVIPTQHLRHQVFGILLREAEEEFGFQQEGVLRLPCEVDVFEKILKMMEDKRSFSSPSLILLNGSTDDDDHDFNGLVGEHDLISTCCSSNNYSSPDSELTSTTPSLQHPQLCR